MAEHAGKGMVERRQRGQVDVLHVGVAEAWQADTIEHLGHDLRAAIGLSPNAAFVLDLSAVRFMTSAVLSLLINIRVHLQGRGYGFAVAGATGDVARMVEHTRLADVMPVYRTVDEATAALDPCRDCKK
jgi:anti-anti-sigma factor